MSSVASPVLFSVEDRVVCAYPYEPRSFMGFIGPGPFSVQWVGSAAPSCSHPGNPHGDDLSGCDAVIEPSHPQLVSVGDPDSGEFLGCLSGCHLAPGP